MSTINKNRVVDDRIRIPVELRKSDQDLFVVSLILPRGYFREPFFIDSLGNKLQSLKSEIEVPTIDKSFVRRFSYKKTDPNVVITPIEKFIKDYIADSSDKKLGFIFHMSRCGSTLVTQMLACNDRFFVLSEPTIIDAVLDPLLEITSENRKKLLVASINALKACSPACCESIFIKFRSWNTIYLNFILERFSNVGWLFMHRNGLEVMMSVFDKPSGWINGRDIYKNYIYPFLGVNKSAIWSMNIDEYVARMLGAFCRIVKNVSSPNKFTLDYIDLKGKYFEMLKKLWNIDLTENEKREMINISLFYSKDVSKKLRFKADSDTKRAIATNDQIELAARFVETERVQLA